MIAKIFIRLNIHERWTYEFLCLSEETMLRPRWHVASLPLRWVPRMRAGETFVSRDCDGLRDRKWDDTSYQPRLSQIARLEVKWDFHEQWFRGWISKKIFTFLFITPRPFELPFLCPFPSSYACCFQITLKMVPPLFHLVTSLPTIFSQPAIAILHLLFLTRGRISSSVFRAALVLWLACFFLSSIYDIWCKCSTDWSVSPHH